MAAVLKWWPKSNLELCEKCGVDEALQQRIEGCLAEVSGLRTSKVVQLLEGVVAAIRETEPVLEAIHTATNPKATYCAHMRTHGTGSAKLLCLKLSIYFTAPRQG